MLEITHIMLGNHDVSGCACDTCSFHILLACKVALQCGGFPTPPNPLLFPDRFLGAERPLRKLAKTGCRLADM